MSAATWFREAMHKEPIVMVSCIIGGIGLALPLVGVPIREFFNTPTPKNPPRVKELIGKESGGH